MNTDEELEKLADQISYNDIQNERIISALRQVRDSAAKDTERLDWLSKTPTPSIRFAWANKPPLWCVSPDGMTKEYNEPTLRAAIDAAMSAEKGDGK